jgi:predicted ATP-binding protein involved in virulence
MRISRISVKKLFGIFSHDIPLNHDDRITIIYGPNGYGKTFTLSLVNELFNPGHDDFYRIPFSELTVEFDDHSSLLLIKEQKDAGDILTFRFLRPGEKTETFVCEKKPSGDAFEPGWLKKLKKSINIWFVHTDRLVLCKQGLNTENFYAVTDYDEDFRDTVIDNPEMFDRLSEKISLLTAIINTRFNYKRLDITRDEGFVFTTSQRRILPPDKLSTGEQHMIMLLYELLFKVRPDSLILIDEPELSMHIVWQQHFIHDLQDIIRLTGFDVLIATHSPQIIHDRWDLAVELKGPSDEAVSDSV